MMMQDRFAIDGHKLYWHLDRVAEWQKDRLIPPIYIEISPVSYCNHRCVFCGLDFAHDQQSILDADILMGKFDEMSRLGVKSIMFAGEGEPLLHPRMVEIAAHARNCGIDASMTTNGMAGNASIMEKLLPSLSWIRFSIDAASSETHSRVHGISPAGFDHCIANLRGAVKIKQEQNLSVTIGVQFLMIQQNLEDIAAALRLYSDIGVDYLSFKPYSEHPQMHNKSGFTYTADMIDAIEKTIHDFLKTTSSKTSVIFRKAATEAYRAGGHIFTSCRALPFWGYISSKGDFYTCSVYLNDDRFKAGSIYSETTENIFFGERREQSIIFAERGLEISKECRVNCRMARINEFLDFLNSKPNHVNFI
jgi:cyclic pyranopterin phosphate synthase